MVDPVVRKGYRLKGPAEVHEPESDVYDQAVRQMRAAGSTLVGRVKAIVVISVQEARPLSSPVYDAENVTEADVIKLNLARFDALYSKRR